MKDIVTSINASRRDSSTAPSDSSSRQSGSMKLEDAQLLALNNACRRALVHGSFLVYPYFGVREITSARNESWVQVEPEAAGAVVSNAEAPCHANGVSSFFVTSISSYLYFDAKPLLSICSSRIVELWFERIAK